MLVWILPGNFKIDIRTTQKSFFLSIALHLLNHLQMIELQHCDSLNLHETKPKSNQNLINHLFKPKTLYQVGYLASTYAN